VESIARFNNLTPTFPAMGNCVCDFYLLSSLVHQREIDDEAIHVWVMTDSSLMLFFASSA
jgi:hypothetical protein